MCRDKKIYIILIEKTLTKRPQAWLENLQQINVHINIASDRTPESRREKLTEDLSITNFTSSCLFSYLCYDSFNLIRQYSRLDQDIIQKYGKLDEKALNGGIRL